MHSFKLLRRALPLLAPRRRLVALGYFCMLLGIALATAQPMLFSLLIDKVLTGGRTEWLAPLLTLSFLFALAGALLGIARGAAFRYLGVKHILDLRERVLAHLRRIPLPEIEKHGPGKYSALLGWDTATVSNFIDNVLVELAFQSATMAFALAMIFYMDWRLGIAALLSAPLLVLVPRLYGKPISRYARRLRAHNEEIGAFMYETIQGSREIRAFGLEAWESERNGSMYRNLVANSTREAVFRTLSGQTSVLAIGAVIVFLYGFGSGQVQSGALTVGSLVAAIQYFNSLLHPITIMSNYFGDIKQGEVALDKIEDFLRIPAETASAGNNSGASNEREPDNSEDGLPIGLEARNLRVSCDGANILRGVGFRVRPGQFAAFVGRSGSGKTTLFKALLGLAGADSGELLLGGRPLAAWTRRELSRRVGVVFQETFVFAGTLLENIAIGRLSAAEEEIYEAACLAGLKPFVDALPHGLRTRIDNQGLQLSGGQRQRVAIARALLKRPDLLILDEPTSALDRATEEEVLASLRERMKGKTVLMSTHRVETVRAADVIYVLDKGSVADAGTHEELAARCPLYRELLAEAYRHDPERSPTYAG
ncbi:ABC transporter ATP-binding protein [Cohnella zeiphila]|uniref:ABC transporter ATP-binding protein n=1 Tax=Cohnella zeiphila TaxID=2761120 RepID=A0A7X0SHJ7_9BACL|nr:ABC transporter ATP-binding protein [Cohnella zeiphila]MBB6729986.1 ABC transporter ATP-binding protein [Cohnella zeiphila]